MIIRWLVAALHLLAMALAAGAIIWRASALRAVGDRPGVARVFRADNLWGLSALLLIGTGLWRAFGGLEKGSGYYLSNDLFQIKMGILAAVLLLEIGPMVTLIRWRIAFRQGATIDTRPARRLARVSIVQAVLVVLLVVAATGMARGFGLHFT